MKQTSGLESQIQLTYHRNMAAFKFYAPALFKSLESLVPTESQLALDDDDELNILQNAQWLYPLSSKKYAELKTMEALTNPHIVKVNPKEYSKRQKTVYLHEHYLARMQDINYDLQGCPTDKTYIPSMVFIGVGLGLHIATILEQKNCHRAYFFEPNLETFYYSMFTLDYSHLFKKSAGKTHFHFCIGQSEIQLLNLIHKNTSKVSIHSNIKFQLVLHDQRQILLDTLHYFENHFSHLFYGFGFIEDEAIGIHHFIDKLQRNDRFIVDNTLTHTACKKVHTDKPPVIIIGSGPSIDQDIATIKAATHQCIVVSCSSSIDILYKNAITPHFHVEVERTHPMVDHFKSFTDPKYLKGITLLALNPVHPEMQRYFKDVIYGFMVGNFAQSIFDHTTEHPFKILSYCNPFAGNGALAMVAALGFQQIILAGMDCGQVSDEYHHSKQSLYYKDNNPALASRVANISVAGNFQDTVKTSPLLDSSRHNLEGLLDENPQLMCFNMSNGAKIRGAQALKPTDLIDFVAQLHLPTPTQQWLEAHVATLTLPICQNQAPKQKLLEFTQHWLGLLDQIDDYFHSGVTFPTTIPSPESMMILLDQWQQSLAQVGDKNPLLYQCIAGSFKNMITIFVTLFFELLSQPNQQARYQKLIQFWSIHFQHVISRLRKDFKKTSDQMSLSSETLDPEFTRLLAQASL